MNIEVISQDRIASAKVSYTPRKVKLTNAEYIISGDDIIPRAGDLVLARVEKIGQHASLELSNGRRATLFVGDEIVVCYGNRYAPDQFEAIVPDNLDTCHLVASGGIAAQALSWHTKMKTPTTIKPIGLLANRQQEFINLSSASSPKAIQTWPTPYTLAVVGTAMNAGKTTTAANLIRGLSDAGLCVGAAKVTGTGSGRDSWLMGDAGAQLVLDFTDAGFPSTYRATPSELSFIFENLTNQLATAGMDVIVLEVADGLYQTETAQLLKSAAFSNIVDGVLFAAGDAMGAAAGTAWLSQHNLPVYGISGLLTASPLAISEAAQATNLPIYDKRMLRSAAIAAQLGVCSKIAVSA